MLPEDHWVILILEAILPLSICLFALPSLVLRHVKLVRAGLYYNRKKTPAVKYKQIFLMFWMLLLMYQGTAVYFSKTSTDDDGTFILYFK